MKKKLIITMPIIFTIILVGIIWWNMPTYFLKNINANEVSCIKVFNGTNGESFEITDDEDIKYIVENIQNIKMKKEKLSIGYLGTSFNITFLDKNNNILDKFIMNAETCIRKDPFFYIDNTNSLCFDYLKDLEATKIGP